MTSEPPGPEPEGPNELKHDTDNDFTERLVAVLYPGAERDVLATLSEYVGAEPERVRCAVLKIADGDEDRLYEAIGVANTDYRDALMRADFGADVTAHLRWAEAGLENADI